MNPSSRLLIPVIIAASSVAASAAVTTTQTFSIAVTDLDIVTTPTTSFSKFNVAGRTLTGVTITYNIKVLSGDVIADNDGASGFNATVTGSLAGALNAGIGIYLPSSVLLSKQTATTVFLGPNAGDTAGVVDGTAPDGTIFSIVNLEDTKSLTIDSTTGGGFFLSNFNGTGTFDLIYAATRGVNISGGAAEGGFTGSTANGYITVSYTSIPEVFSSLATASVLLLGFVGYRPRRDAQAT